MDGISADKIPDVIYPGGMRESFRPGGMNYDSRPGGMSHVIVLMADPSWCTRHCAPVLCVGIMSVSQLLSGASSGHDIAPMVFSTGSPHKV